MLNKMSIFVGLCSLFISPLVNAKSMTQFYGSQKYNGLYDYNDLKRTANIDSKHENGSGYDGLIAYGRHVNLTISESDTGNVVLDDHQRVRQYIGKYARKDDAFGQESLGACQFFHDQMIDIDNDADQNLKLFLQNMPKWRIFREPKPLRQTRIKIYFNKRAVRILTKRIQKETDEAKREILELVKAHFAEKVTALYSHHDELMSMNLKWKPRRWIWANLTTNNVLCFSGESSNPEEFYMVKKEIQRIKEIIEATLNSEAMSSDEKMSSIVSTLVKKKKEKLVE